jgi:hypothetical protein
MRKWMLVVLLAATSCGDDLRPAPPDGAVSVSHGGEPPPDQCAPGWTPTDAGCAPPACEDGLPVPCSCAAGGVCETPAAASACFEVGVSCPP